MLITTTNEIQSMMPTARWDRPQQLFGYLEEEESVALEPLLGPTLYSHVISEYDRLRETYGDITATAVRPTGKAKEDARLAHADITERLEQIREGKYRETFVAPEPGEKEVPEEDMQAIRLIRICQQIEFYRMLSHKAGMLTVSFNEGGGMNIVTADGYDPAEEKRMDRVVKDAFMSAGRSTDSLLLFLEADAKGKRQFTEKWQDADAFYLHRDLLFQTARVLNEYLDIKGERMAYVQLVRDIRFCQNTYLKPRIGAKLLKAVVTFANAAPAAVREHVSVEGSSIRIKADEGRQYCSSGQVRSYEAQDGEMRIKVVADDERFRPSGRISKYVVEDEAMRILVDPDDQVDPAADYAVYDELLSLLRTALAFYVEARRISVTHVSSAALKEEALARRDSMTDAQQAMAMACQYVEDNIDALGDAAVGSPIYNAIHARKEQDEHDRQCARAAEERRRSEACERGRRKLFTAFPVTHLRPETK